jgi:hypothetical protein
MALLRRLRISQRLPQCGAILVLAAAGSAGARIKVPRIHLGLALAKGEAIRYRIDTETSVEGSTTSPIRNAEGSKKEIRSTSLEITLLVLEVPSATSGGGAAGARMRVTYDLADATAMSDAYDPAADAQADAFKKLQGRALEFTMTPDGGISNVTGLEDIFSNPTLARSAKDWLDGFNYAGGMPNEGIAVGQKWGREALAENLPLRGLVWRFESTYLRNEACAPENIPGAEDASPVKPPPAGTSSDVCAVILTESSLVRKGSAHGDATPEDYLHNGLRTSGTWTANGENLESISLRTGWIVVSTATLNEQMDYLIKSVQTGSALHHTGSVKTETHLTLIPPAEH